MFKDISCIERSIKINNSHFLFKIIDDDFEEEIEMAPSDVRGFRYRGSLIKALVRCYENKGLNVSANLALFFGKRYLFSVKFADLDYCLPEVYIKYKDKIEQYLLLM